MSADGSQKDPIGFAGGDVDLYGYCLNDPVNLIDPPGLVIKYAGNFLDRLYIGINMWGLAWNSPTARELIRQLESNPQSVTINLTHSGNSYDPCINQVRFNPDKYYIYNGQDPWNYRPAEIGLAHELIHALHDVTQTMGNTRMNEENRTVGLGPYANDPITENAVRGDYGIPLRPTY
jgi:hypothetical protein